MHWFGFCICFIFLTSSGIRPALSAETSATRPVPRTMVIPKARWDHRPGSEAWTLAAMSAMARQGAPLTRVVPRDIAAWCPGYASADEARRRAFWVGLLSALAKYESTYRPRAVGGGGLWYGLLQILPSTARLYRCKARTGGALKDGGANLSCAIRIMARTVPRDGVIAVNDGQWRGVAADWGPMRSKSKRADMQTWLRGQSYCAVTRSPRPQRRPMSFDAQRNEKHAR